MSTMVPRLLCGNPGSGKTTLAVHWARRVRHRFPDGQLYLNPRGYHPEQPMIAVDALVRLLAALGIAGPDLPSEADKLATRYRTEIAGRRILIVLDNAATMEQIRPLLPGTPTCAVVVTSRDTLAGLIARDRAQRLDLDLLPLADAIALLRRLIGTRADAEPEAASALAQSSAAKAHHLLELLARAHLINHSGAERYGTHDLLRAYAARLAATVDNEEAHRAALERMFDYYLATAATAMDCVHPAEAHLRPRIPAPALPIPDLVDHNTALRWLDTERATLTAIARHAVSHGWHTHAVRLSAILYRYLDEHTTDAQAIHGHAQTAVRHMGDLAGQAQALLGLGAAHGKGGQYRLATEILKQALTLFREINDQTGQAQALTTLGMVERRLGCYGPAADHLNQALTLYRHVDDLPGEARALTSLGLVERQLGRYGPAADHHKQALAIFQRKATKSVRLPR